MTRPVLAAESVTELGAEVQGAVLVAGSHGGLIACYLGASAGAHALVLNDAGVGLDGAGIAGLAQLDAIGMAAATVACMSARIGDGKDSLARGLISHCNRAAADAGLDVGMSVRAAARLLCDAPPPHSKPSPYAEARWQLGKRGAAEVWAIDSVGKLVPEDDGRILLIGSHGGLQYHIVLAFPIVVGHCHGAGAQGSQQAQQYCHDAHKRSLMGACLKSNGECRDSRG